MEYLSLDEILYIMKFLNFKNTFILIKSLNLKITDIFIDKKIMVVEQLFNAYFEKDGFKNMHQLFKELIYRLHYDGYTIDIEDLICLMANIYPNRPYLKNTILFDLLKLYNISKAEWNLIQVHFKL